MLTGTPLDLTVIPEMLAWLGKVIPIVWLVLLIASLVQVGLQFKSAVGRCLGISVVLVVLVLLPILIAQRMMRAEKAQQLASEKTDAEFKARLEVAEVLFKKRCETAGEFIDKTVPDVKGVVWMKWRMRPAKYGRGQFDRDDIYGSDCEEQGCIEQFLRSTFVVPNHDMNKPYLPENGYEFVETTDPRDGEEYRYIAGVVATVKRTPENRAKAIKNNNGVDPGEYVFGFGMQREPIKKFSAGYGITWEEVSTREDREHWIAGGAISIIDLQTNKLVAKRVGYMMDPGLGSTAGFRDPWGFARYNSCPEQPKLPDGRPVSREDEKKAFVFKVLQPTKGEIK
jgi:hypothetical protein